MAPSHGNWLGNHIPAIFFHLTPRFICLRIVCLSSLGMSIYATVGQNYYYTCLGLIVFLHHTATAFGPRLSLPGSLDLALVALEIYCLLPGRKISKFSTRVDVVTSTLIWVTIACLAILAVLRIAIALKKGWSSLWTRYDITAPEYRHAWGLGSIDNDIQRKTLQTKHILFGSSNWKSHFPGETHWIIISRGILAVALLVLISIFAIYLIVLDPVQETGVTPVKESRTIAVPADFERGRQPVYNVVVGRPMIELPQFSSAVKVELLKVNNTKDDCDLVEYLKDSSGMWLPPNVQGAIPLDVITFKCYPTDSIYLTRDDILVTVNFTMININPNLYTETRDNSVQVFVGSTDTISDVLSATPPTSLIPGVNLVGFGQDQLRKRFARPTVSAFGIFDSYSTFYTTEIVHVWPDPRAGTSLFITRAVDVGTLRIVRPFYVGEMKIIQQNLDKSVLKGFASIGGLWTFLGGIFTTLFGTSILRIIFGTKPISVFGLTRTLLGDKLKEACHTKYPQIASDLKVQPADKGLVAFLADHLVDIDVLKDSGGRSSRESLHSVEDKDGNPAANIVLPIANYTTTQPPSAVHLTV